MSETYRTSPVPTDKMPPGIGYIVGNEAAERFSFYGMKTILYVFLTKYLMDATGKPAHLDSASAESAVHWFNFANYALPVLGAILSDVFLGKYRTILYLSLVYCAGHLVLSGWLTPAGVCVGLLLIAMGSGGIKPCVSAHVGDQFGHRNKDLLPRVYSWFYFSINFGSFFSTLLTPWLLKNPDYGPHWAFGVPAVLMGIATLMFWLGRNKYAHIPPSGPAVWLSCLKGERLRIIGRLSIIFLFMAFFWAIYDQTATVWVEQAKHMNQNFGTLQIGDWRLPIHLDESQLQAVNPILVLIYIPLFTIVIYPLCGSFLKDKPLRKVAIGFLLTAATCGLTAMIESWLQADHLARSVAEAAAKQAGQEFHWTPTVHAGWQVLAYVIITAAEVLAYFTCLEFSYTQAPPEMKSVVMSINLLSVSVGNFFTATITGLIAVSPDFKAWLHGARFHWFYGGVMFVVTLGFMAYARTYRGQTYLQDEPVVDEAEMPGVDSRG